MNTIQLERGETAIITLTRPQALNALNAELLGELARALEEVRNSKDARCLIITGAGEKSFAAGADVGAMEAMDSREAMELAQKGCRVMDAVAELEIPVIAAINGYALGGGLELALSCDIRVASDNAVIGLPEVTLGIMPGWGGTRRLSQAVGYANAAWMVFSGAKVGAEEAVRMGLVNACVPQAELMNTVRRMATNICACAPLGVSAAKKAMREYAGMKQSGELENKLFALLFETQDQKTGMHHFNQKKKTERFEGK